MLNREHVRLRHSGSIQEYRKKFGEITYTKLTYHRYHHDLAVGVEGGGVKGVFTSLKIKVIFFDGQHNREIFTKSRKSTRNLMVV